MTGLGGPITMGTRRHAKRLKDLERENARLKKIVADQLLDLDMLKELNRGNW
jgi:putative transposase